VASPEKRKCVVPGAGLGPGLGPRPLEKDPFPTLPPPQLPHTRKNRRVQTPTAAGRSISQSSSRCSATTRSGRLPRLCPRGYGSPSRCSHNTVIHGRCQRGKILISWADRKAPPTPQTPNLKTHILTSLNTPNPKPQKPHPPPQNPQVPRTSSR